MRSIFIIPVRLKMGFFRIEKNSLKIANILPIMIEIPRRQIVPGHDRVPFYCRAQKSRVHRYHPRSRFSYTQAPSALTNLTRSVHSSAQ